MPHTSPPCPPLSFLRFWSFLGLSLRLFRWFLRPVSLPQSRAKYSLFTTPIFLSCPLSAALSAFLSFVSKAFGVSIQALRASAAKRHRVCVCRPLVKGFPFLTSTANCFTSRGTEHSLANSVQRSYALEWEARIDHPCVPAKTFAQAV